MSRTQGTLPSFNGQGVENLSLKIADLTIALSSRDHDLTLRVQGALESFLVDGSDPDVSISVAWEDLSEDQGGQRLFDSGALWQLFDEGGRYCFRFVSPAFGPHPYRIARFAPDFSSGEVYLQRGLIEPGEPVYPLDYPLDELVTLNLLAQGRGVEVHGCGIVDAEGRGLLFAGQSGAGKTTMARLWQKQKGITVLSDDRIILRRRGDRIWMYGTPWHGDAELACPAQASLASLYFLRHGSENKLASKKGAEAAALLLACGFPPFYSAAGLEFTLEFSHQATEAIPCHELYFVPDDGVIKFLRQEIAQEVR